MFSYYIDQTKLPTAIGVLLLNRIDGPGKLGSTTTLVLEITQMNIYGRVLKVKSDAIRHECSS